MDAHTPPATIMVVDDSPTNLALLNSVLSQSGYRVLQFPRAGMALNAAAKHPPDLILLDIMMPEIDGFAMCQRLKADARLRTIPVIFISAMSDLDHKLRAFSEGGVDYVTKPFQEEEVLVRVATQLKLRRVQRELELHQQHLQTLVDQRTADLYAERLRLRNALDAVQAGTWEWQVGSGELVINERWAQICGYTLAELLPTTLATWQTRLHPDDAEYVQQCLTRHLEGTERYYEVSEYRMRHKQGRWVWVHSLGRVIERNAAGEPLQVAGIQLDITARKQHQAQLDYIARHDDLTGLPNRLAFTEQLRDLMVTGQTLAVAYIDLDDIVALNETYSRTVVDQYLCVLARRLSAVAAEPQHVARIGGDEFAVLLSGADASMTRLGDAVLAAVCRPVTLAGQMMSVTASIGVTSFPQVRTVDADQLLRQADQAMYRAKLAGKNRYHLFDPEYDQMTRERYLQLDDLQRGLQAGEFVLYYQPKVNLRTGVLRGFEALIRWQHPQRGLLAPGAFIPLIENHPLSIPLGNWVIEAALSQLEQWQQAGLDTSVAISVNISTVQLHDDSFVSRLKKQLQAHPQISPSHLELEILETGAINDMDRAAELTKELGQLGVVVSLDDFGTGYSSLTFLKRLAVDVLKIDQSFVRQMLDDRDHLVIIESILHLAQSFEREVIAEGIENETQGCLLLELGCEFGQGYGIARPMPAEQAIQWLRDWRPPPSWRHVRTLAKDRLPMLLAEAEHRAWFNALCAYLHGQTEHSPTLDASQCRFGRWLLSSQAQQILGDHPAWTTLHAQHDVLHKVAQQGINLSVHQRPALASELLAELGSIHEALLALLQQVRR